MGLYENILDACARHDIAPSRLIIESGFASSNIARLKKGKAPHLDMIQGMAERLGMSIDELVYGRDGIVILTDTEKQQLKANGRKNLDVLDADEKELLSIYRSIPVEKRSMCKDFLRTHVAAVADPAVDAEKKE